tara:strand:+ start:221 stop:424 length:204 start_codon:yes stop_codon:yes gene_type:complete
MKLSTERKLLDETLQKVNECRIRIRHDPMLLLSLENVEDDLKDRIKRIDDAIAVQGGWIEYIKEMLA